MIWAMLLYGIAQANEWIWSLTDNLPLTFIDATYDLVDTVQQVMADGVGLDIFPVDGAVMWVRMIFWSFGIALLLRVISRVLGIIFGARNPS